jgi:hypothetical protein
MDVTMAVVARDARYVASGLGGRVLNISSVVGHVKCDELPCAIGRICVAIGFSADAAEVGMQQTIRVRLTEPDGTALGELEYPYTVPEPSFEGSPTLFNIVFPFEDFAFRQAGPHDFGIWVGDNHKTDIPLYVVVAQGES